MKKMLLGLVVVVTGVAYFLYSADRGFSKQLAAPESPAFVNAVPDDWEAFKHNKMAARDAHIAKYQTAYNRFADFAQSETDGVPYIILKLLPNCCARILGRR